MQIGHEEYSKLKAKYESLMDSQRLIIPTEFLLSIEHYTYRCWKLTNYISLMVIFRHLLGEDLGLLSIKELQNLEKMLEGTLSQARQRKVPAS